MDIKKPNANSELDLILPFKFLSSLIIHLHLLPFLFNQSRSGELRMQKLQSYPVRTQSLNGLPLRPGVGQHIAIHATFTARNFFLTYFYPAGPFACVFSRASPDFFPVLAVANAGFCVGLQNKIGHPAGCRFPC